MNKYLKRFILSDPSVKRIYEDRVEENVNMYKCVATAYKSKSYGSKLSRKQAEIYVTHKFLQACYVRNHPGNGNTYFLDCFYRFRPNVIPFWYKLFILLKYTFKGNI